MGELAWVAALYGVGVLLAGLGRRSLPWSFICLTGFLWGALTWVLVGVICLLVGLTYSAGTMIGLLGVTAGMTVIGHVRASSWRLTRSEALQLAGGLILVVAIGSMAARHNFAWPTNDSALQVMLGRAIALDGYVRWPEAGVGLYGIFIPLLHSAGVFFGQGYLVSAHPLIACAFLAGFWGLSVRVATANGAPRGGAATVASLGVGLLMSSYVVAIQAVWIHNSLVSAAFLFVGVAAAWLAVHETSETWFALAMAAMTGFTLARLEAPLFSIALLAIVFSTRRLPYRTWVRMGLPFLVLVTAWYVKLLLFTHQSPSKFLTPVNSWVMLGILVAFTAFMMGSRIVWIDRVVAPRVHVILLLVLGTALAWSFVAHPAHMSTGLVNVLKNVSYHGLWGASWIIAAVLLCLAPMQPRIPHERLFAAFIPAFLLLLFAVGGQRAPYRLGYGDSANRMLTHLLPVMLLYITVKHGRGFRKPSSTPHEPDIMPAARQAMAVAGGLLLLAGWLWLRRPT